jgi:hypothetical protein
MLSCSVSDIKSIYYKKKIILYIQINEFVTNGTSFNMLNNSEIYIKYLAMSKIFIIFVPTN